MWQGSVVAIHIAAGAAKPVESVPEVRAIPGKGLDGDRYFRKIGTYSNHPGSGREVTLVEAEAIEALARDQKIQLAPGASRRNITTRGVPLSHLVGRRFRIGQVLLEGTRLCEPCTHLEGLTQKGVLGGLIHRGGLRTVILEGGTIRVGDHIRPAE